MSNNNSDNKLTPNMHMHVWVQDQLPWLVNGTLDDVNKRKVHQHLNECLYCQQEFEQQRGWHKLLVQESTVEYAPQASLHRMINRIDQPSRMKKVFAKGHALVNSVFTFAGAKRSHRHYWPIIIGTQTATVFVLALVVGWNTLRPMPTSEKDVMAADHSARYQTLTTSTEKMSATHLQVVFDDQVTLEDVRHLLQTIDAHIASGPSEQGVLRIQLNDSRNVDTASQWLGEQPGVIFVAVEMASELSDDMRATQ